MLQSGTCYIVGAGAFYDRDFVPEEGDFVIAADGGYGTLSVRQTAMDLVVGDFDSMGFRPDHPKVVDLPVEKDDTDAMLAARRGLALGFREFLYYGSLDGKRLDHTVANYQTLQYLADHGARGYLVGQDFLVTVVKEGRIFFPEGTEGLLSVFCLGADARGVSLRGLYYPLEGGTLTAGFPLGVSNHFTGAPAEISVEAGSLLVMWERKNGFPQWK